MGEGLADTADRIAVEFGARLLGALGDAEAKVLLERIEVEAAAVRPVGALNRACGRSLPAIPNWRRSL